MSPLPFSDGMCLCSLQATGAALELRAAMLRGTEECDMLRRALDAAMAQVRANQDIPK